MLLSNNRTKWINFKFHRNDFSHPFSLKVPDPYCAESTINNFDPRKNTFNKYLFEHTFREESSIMSRGMVTKFYNNFVRILLSGDRITEIQFHQDKVLSKALGAVQKVNKKSFVFTLKEVLFLILILAIYFEYKKLVLI
jgi:hypothetical protein